MQFTRKHMEPLGFRGSSPFQSRFQNNWWRSFPEARKIIGISSLWPKGVYMFSLTPEQMRLFEQNKLSVVPPGCVSVSTLPSVDNYRWLHEGEVKNMKQLLAALKRSGVSAFQ